MLTGKKEPNVAANELAVQAVDQENSALEQEINNLKTELELRARWPAIPAMAIIQRHSARADSRGGIFEGDTTRDRLRKSRSRGAVRHEPAGGCGCHGCSTAASAWRCCGPLLVVAAAVAVEHRRHPRGRRRRGLAALAAGARRPLLRVAAVPLRATAYGWWWMRRRLLRREPSRETHQRLLHGDRSRDRRGRAGSQPTVAARLVRPGRQA